MLWIQDWDFNWQDRYDYSRCCCRKARASMPMIIYDNSADNPHNPATRRAASRGAASLDEMGR